MSARSRAFPWWGDRIPGLLTARIPFEVFMQGSCTIVVRYPKPGEYPRWAPALPPNKPGLPLDTEPAPELD